jgi:tetratricopeptide (TPR) repeat protein
MIRRESMERAFALGLLGEGDYLRATLDREAAWEILRNGNAVSRLEMIRELLERTDAVAMEIARTLTRDPSEAVRMHAAQALAVMEARLRLRIQRAEEKLAHGTAFGWRWSEAGEAYLAMARAKEGVPVLCDHYLQQAVTAFRRALQYETRAEWLLWLAEAEELGRQWVQAQALARQALDRDPFDVRALLLLARIAYRMGRFQEAKPYMRRLSLVPELSPQAEDLLGCWMPAAA